MTILAKDFGMPTSATSGVQDYDLEGARRKKFKPSPRAKGPPLQMTEEKHRVTPNADMNEDPKERAKKQQTRAQDPNADDAITDDAKTTKRQFSDKERDAAADSGAALPDGSYPIKNASDLKNAVQAYGRAKNKARAKAHIIARAKALGATDSLPDDWKKSAKADITTCDAEELEKFLKAHGDNMNKALNESPDIEFTKGIYDVSTLAGLIAQLKAMADGQAWERRVEGDNSTIPERLRDEAAILLQVLSDMSSEEAQELNEGTTAEDVIADSSPTMEAGLYRSDVSTLAKDLRKALGLGDDELTKEGRRNSSKDLETIQKVHDAACELGADCTGPHDQDGKDVSKETSDMGTANKADTVMAEGNKRGSSVTDPSLPADSKNADDKEHVADAGQEKAAKAKARMDADEDRKKKRKARADEDDDADDDDDEDCKDDDSDDDEDDDEDVKPKKKAKKAKKSFDAEELAKVIATAVATAMAPLLAKSDQGDEKVIPRARPNLLAVGKDGEVAKFEDSATQIDRLVKSVTPVQGASQLPDGSDKNDTTLNLIKAIHKNHVMVPASDLRYISH